jgi:cellulose synthase/poly-beta-1,6-N-acetylglucosamine synthase-like glycosyltransferase
MSRAKMMARCSLKCTLRSDVSKKREQSFPLACFPSSTLGTVVTTCRELATGDPPRVSIVVPVRNRSAMIRPCIESLLAQSYPKESIQIIVVDNDSSDDTGSVVSHYPVTLLSERDFTTSYAARNRGIAHADGEIVAFLDSDCVASPDWVTELIAPLADDGVGAVVGTIEDAAPQTLCEEFTTRLQPFARPERQGLKTLLTANVAIRRSALEAVGLFDECLPTAGDVDLGWRLQLSLGLTIAEAPAARVQHNHRTTFRGVFAQYKRYGQSEILLTTLYRGGAGSLTAGQQRRRMLRQGRAIASYLVSFTVRVATAPFRRTDRAHLLWPLFLLTVEVGNVAGKLLALLATRCYRRNPYASSRSIDR